MARTFYKFISLENEEHQEWFNQIIESESLYMINYKGQENVNDKKEGRYNVSSRVDKCLIESITEAKMKILICSLARRIDCYLWEKFADNAKGVCIQLKVNDSTANLVNIKYRRKLRKFSKAYIKRTRADEMAKKILVCKRLRYRKENECRAMKVIDDSGNNSRLSVCIIHIYLGWNMSQNSIREYTDKLNEKRIKVSVSKPPKGVHPLKQIYRGIQSRFYKYLKSRKMYNGM